MTQSSPYTGPRCFNEFVLPTRWKRKGLLVLHHYLRNDGSSYVSWEARA